MIKIATKHKPNFICIVPEKREEITTEGGLDVSAKRKELQDFVDEVQSSGIPVSLFIDPIKEQIEASSKIHNFLKEKKILTGHNYSI